MRTDWEELWRYCAPINPDQMVDGEKPKINIEPTTKLGKFQKAIRYHMGKMAPEEADGLVKKIIGELEQSWHKLR